MKLPVAQMATLYSLCVEFKVCCTLAGHFFSWFFLPKEKYSEELMTMDAPVNWMMILLQPLRDAEEILTSWRYGELQSLFHKLWIEGKESVGTLLDQLVT